jgi:phage tail-like protein
MPITMPDGDEVRIPYSNFAFHVSFEPVDGIFKPGEGLKEALLGGFSEISGLEAMMEHKVIKVGGRNYGPAMRAGAVSFGTVVMKRGVIHPQNLWRWWSMFAGADGERDGRPLKANRSNVLIGLISTIGDVTAPIDPRTFKPESIKRAIRIGWRLKNAMPVKFRVSDFNAKGNEVAIEELHLVHEGLQMNKVIS